MEAKLVIALKACKNDSKLNLRAASKIYTVPYTTLHHRHSGTPSRCNTPANSRKLTDLEEKTIIQYILKLYAYVFHPQLLYVEDIANQLLRKRNAPPISV